MIEVKSELEMRELGARLGRAFSGGETVELVGDVGAGKTTLVRGIAAGMGITETVQSPSFTINRVYDAPNNRRLVHYDFYRLADPGIMRDELAETVSDPATVAIIEWAETVDDTLPVDRLVIMIASPTETSRTIELRPSGTNSQRLAEAIE